MSPQRDDLLDPREPRDRDREKPVLSVFVTSQERPLADVVVTAKQDVLLVRITGRTDAEGQVRLTVPRAGLYVVRLEAEGYRPATAIVELRPRTETPLVIALDPARPAADLRQIRANFCSLWDYEGDRPIFTANYPSMDAVTRTRWRAIAKAAGDTHFCISNPTTAAADYHDQRAYTDWLGRGDEYARFLDELLEDGLWPIVYVHSGDYYPRIRDYHRNVVRGIPATLHAQAIWVCGWETVAGGYTTAQFIEANRQLREALGPEPLMACHLSDGRLSFSSHPVEPDDPYQGDELACWRDPQGIGKEFAFWFCQQDLIEESDVDGLDPRGDGPMARTLECLTRVQGTQVDGAPDWFAGLPSRPIPVFWEQNEELYYKKRCSREWMLQIWNVAKGLGFQGYGCGLP